LRQSWSSTSQASGKPARAGRGAWAWLCAALLVLLAGCASGPNADPRDPLEPFNRSMTKFNDAVDTAVLKPVATAYVDVVPSPVRTGIGNFFSNLGDAWSFVNNVLQAKPEGALHSFWRVVINTTLGLGGILDPASEMRLVRHKKDFGQPLGYWGVPPGPYLVLPFLGPSTLRDTVALPVDFYYGDPMAHVYGIYNASTLGRYAMGSVHLVDTRAQLLGATNLLSAAALDPYSFLRDAFLQKRRNDIYDGNPPPQESERFDLDPDPAPTTPAK
jgi:phospholipid-binding lipoprotein MlaA